MDPRKEFHFSGLQYHGSSYCEAISGFSRQADRHDQFAVAKEIDANPQIRLILFGGELNRDREAFEGQTVLEQMKTCFINYAFVSSAGCSLEAGITDSTREEADIRRQVLKQAKHKILVVDNTKIGRNEVYVIGELEQLSQVVVDHSIRKTNPDLWEWFQAHQIPVLEGKAERKSKTKGDER